MNNFPALDKDAMYLFNNGKNYYSYRMLGAHRAEGGYHFAVWAPNAKSVSVVCDRNSWDRNLGAMQLHKESGIWEAFVENMGEGEPYKYSIEGADGKITLKIDPFAYQSEIRPKNASVTAELSYAWRDGAWMKKRKSTPPYDAPMNIYELHFASWKQHEDGSFYTYREMAEELIPYVKKMNYTHIELMPMCEFPFDGSWGYQVTGYYAANSRFGKPSDFKYFIDMCHKGGISVIMDWVPAHFPRDAYALARFDGTPLFEHPDSRLGEHKEWGTYVFNWSKAEIHSFLISNAVFWFDEFHMDGLRVDAVSSMLYLDYNRKDGEWVANKYGGNENLDAVDFLQKLNIAVFERFPNALMIAEESTAWAGVTKPVYEGGLGFNFKWNMGWMNDILRYMSMDPYFRGPNHNMLTFSMMYAYSENYILALSHDEVVHGKCSLIGKMSGSYEQKFKSLRLLYAYMYAHPGKKLLFMGGEFAQFIEWRFAEGLDWEILRFELHSKMQEYVRELNGFYASHRSMYENDSDWDGFRWINAGDRDNNTVSFIRQSRSGRDKTIFVGNFAAKSHEKYRIGVWAPGWYKTVLNTDEGRFGGSGGDEPIYFKAEKKPSDGFEYSIEIELPELCAMYIKKTGRRG